MKSFRTSLPDPHDDLWQYYPNLPGGDATIVSVSCRSHNRALLYMPSTLENFRPDQNDGLAIWFRLRGSVIWKVLPQILFVTLWGALWTALYILLKWPGLSASLIPVLSIVVGLLLVFRTNAAYDRFYEGRRLWAQLGSVCKNTARMIWCNCPDETDEQKVLKRVALRLVIAFPIAVKNHLRMDHDIDHDNLSSFLPPLPEFSHGAARDRKNYLQIVKTGSGLNLLGTDESQSVRTGSRASMIQGSPETKSQATFPPKKDLHYYNYACGCVPIPLEITGLLCGYGNFCGKGDAISANVSTMIGIQNDMQRILSTPVPVVYNLHLKHTILLYLLTLPFQLVASLGWYMIPAMFVFAFTLLGIEGIGAEIENPFGLDKTDLPLERFCKSIREEIETMIDRPPPKAKEWLPFLKKHETHAQDDASHGYVKPSHQGDIIVDVHDHGEHSHSHA
ncbi:Bestrophin, RFP-TM, chloride channel-domain-containing protein [Polychytrium aggregatum]|uniref:Bestrophin, RFP-TM, chloride channel-domain-containing protein n=1 Tax=Polychytrium aggregatum TaxID=110093 RepID=UPI0022FDC213|nr:Bestrophin, RFP-TM, chloride channel-domain-containing protein [Polychytrium aggregatum]KAI9197418.1 Bestrophin, RFP-TM, chloride channel-domain-containing protein [Polychytrium aggregatum]